MDGLVVPKGSSSITLSRYLVALTILHPLTCYNTQATIVTADGSVLTASSTENPDLFFGIRGGGCNFGVATEFVLQLHAQRATVYAGVLIYSPVHLEAIVNATAAWLPTAGKDEAMLQMTVVGPEGQVCAFQPMAASSTHRRLLVAVYRNLPLLQRDRSRRQG